MSYDRVGELRGQVNRSAKDSLCVFIKVVHRLTTDAIEQDETFRFRAS
jgi:hypothetical protein